MSTFSQTTLAVLGLVMLGSTAVAQSNSDNFAGVDPAPSGTEMQNVYVGENSVIALPGPDSGIVSFGGYAEGGQQLSNFDFEDSVSGGGGSGGWLDDLVNSTIYYEFEQ